MGSSDDEAKADFRVDYQPWPADKEFPLTPLEAWYIMRGYAVRPARAVSMEEFLEFSGKLEMSDGYIMLWQS